ncbi:hypothetical protein PviCFBP13515_12445 [Pseudomonas viridiflava]|nr:hypothetical protein PviCFBP13507_05810 [Pseudomonas viridiflava]TKK27459.1 hypothetical protein PviCFBP13515_12445 [Pseudomonas viridiflava]
MVAAFIRMIYFRRATCKLAAFGFGLFSGAKYRINGRLNRPSFAKAYKSFNESTQVTRRRQLYHNGFPGSGLHP